MNDEATVLVTGATGNTGSEIAGILDQQSVAYRAMVRSEADRSRVGSAAEVALADFDDAAAVRAALDGVRRAYLVTPSSERAERQQVDFVEQAARAGVERIVLLSQLGAAVDSPVRFLRYHAVVEQRVRELGLDFTFLRPNLFFQGLLAFAGTIRDNGRFGAPIGGARVSAVDVRDIAAVAAAALTEDEHGGATYTLTGPEALTHEEMAEALSAATGRQVEFADAPPEAFAASLEGILPPWQVGGLLEDYAHYARGEAAAVTSVVEDVTGRPARSFERFATDLAPAFGGRAA